MLTENLRNARRSVLAIPGDGFALLVVTGTDRISWLNGLVTCELKNLKPGEATYGLLVKTKGKIVCDFVVVIDHERVIVVLNAEVVGEVRAIFDRYLVMEDAEVTELEGELTWLYGPSSPNVIEAALQAGGVAGRIDLTELGGGIVIADRANAASVSTVRDALDRSLAEEGGTRGTADDWEVLRLERGVPKFGPDFGENTYPHEAGLDKTAVSFSKGCYLGQEVVCMLELRGHVKRKIASIVCAQGDVPPVGTHVIDQEGVDVGEVTSAAWSPSLSAPVVLAMVKRARAVPGEALRMGTLSGVVVERPC